jgi:FAD:protein FMN transferase
LAENPRLGSLILMWIRNLQIAVFSCLAADAAEVGKFRFERELMATRFTIVCYTDDKAVAEKAAEAAFAIADQVNAVASDYLPGSELSKLSSQPVGQPIFLSPTLHDLLGRSRRLAESTHGAFDPTLASLTKLWRETRRLRRLPDPEKLKTAREAVGWQHFTLDPKTRSIILHREHMAFDLGGIAKGYAADRMLESLADAGISRAMIVAGGDVRLGDAPPGRDGWSVGVQTFDANQSDEILVLANAAVSTSGDLYQSVEIDGVKYSHILDPSTGLGLTRRIAATVIADGATLSDPLATAACVMGPDAAAVLEKIPGVREVKIRALQEKPPDSRSLGPLQSAEHEK